MFDCVVIGAGVSGMTAALILARHGWRVVVVEQASRSAPVLRGFWRDDVYFDTGFHLAGALGPGQIMDILFRYLGVRDHIQTRPYDPDGFEVLRDERSGVEIRVPYGTERVRERLHALFPGEAGAVDEYLRLVQQTWDSFPYLNLEADLAALGGTRTAHGPTLAEVLGRLTGSHLLRSVLSMHCLLHGVPPAFVPFAIHAVVSASYYQSAHAVVGGGGRLAAAFDEAMGRAGVRVLCGRAATGIRVATDGAPFTVHLEGGEALSGTRVISTIHPRRFLGLVPEGLFRPAFCNRLRGLEDTSGAYTAFVRTTAPVENLTSANLYLAVDGDPSDFNLGGPLGRRPMYVTTALGPGGGPGAGCIAICPADPKETAPWADSRNGQRPESYQEFKARAATALISRLKRSCPELAARMASLELATPLTFRDYHQSPEGSLYGVAHRVGQYNPEPMTRIRGLLQAGQAVAAPGVLGAMVSSFLACGTLLGHERLREALRQCR